MLGAPLLRHPRSSLRTSWILMIKFLSVVSVILLLVAGAWAVGNCDGSNTCYVSKIATGTGTGADWTNACTDFTGACDVTSASMRGTTIYVAGSPGNPIGAPYTAATFSAPDSGTTPITIIKASSANHGTQTGWKKEYAVSAMILLAPVTISTDYWNFDGQWRAGNWRSWHDFAEVATYPSMCATGGFWNIGYHFNIVNTSGTTDAVTITGSHVSIKNVEIHGSRTVATGTDRGVHFGAGVSNEYLGYSEVCYTGGNLVDMSSASAMTFEYNHFAANHQGSTSLSFPSAFNVGDVTSLTIRYNEFRDVTGSILTDGNTDASSFVPSWYFYGNAVWWNPASVVTSSTNGGLAGIVNLVGETFNGGVVQVYNNTFAELNVSQCTTGLTCNAIALNLNGAAGGSCAAHTQNCKGASTPVGTAYNNLWWDGFAGQNVANSSSAQWTATGDFGEGACLTTGCSNGGTWTVVGANDVNVTEANPFESFYRPAIVKCDELPNGWQVVGDQFNGCYFDFHLTSDTAAGTSPSGWDSSPSGCTNTAGGNCENVDRTGVVRGTLGTGSQVSRGAFQFVARRLVRTNFNSSSHSFTQPLAVQGTGLGLTVGSTVQEIAQCTWNVAPITDACPDSSPPFTKTWESLDPTVATINSSGLVTAVAAHNAIMRLAYGGTPYIDSNVNIVVWTGTEPEPIATLPTGIVRSGSPLITATYDTTTYDTNFPTTYSDPCPINGVGGCKRWGVSPNPPLLTAGDFTNALNSSNPGDTIVLQAGTTYSTNGSFSLPARSNPSHKWTYIISSNEASLPPQGTRVSPNDEPNMAILAETGGSTLINIASQADHWWVSGIEAICTNTVGTPRPICGARIAAQVSVIPSDLPDSITVDRCYFHGDDNHDTPHGVELDASHFALLDSYVSTFGYFQQQAQALEANLTPGPLKIINNLIANGWGETSIMGGAGGFGNPYVISDVYFKNNTITSLQTYRATGITIPPAAKWEFANNFEFKSCLRCLADGNILANSWASAQGGANFVMNAGTGPNGPNVVVNDMTFTNNILIGGLQPMGNGGQFAGQLNGCDPLSATCYYPGENRRITILNNLAIQGPQGAPGGRALIGNATIFSTIDRFTTDYLFQHNTLVGPYLTDRAYCENSLKFQSNTGDNIPTSNVWLLDNVICRQLSSNLAGNLTGTTLLNSAMNVDSGVPVSCTSGFSPPCRFYGNVMEYFPSQHDVAATWPTQNQPINQEGGSPVIYNSPQTGDYTMTSPTQTGSDGIQSGIDYTVLVAHQAPALGSCSIAGTVTGSIASGAALVLTGQSTATVYSYTDGTYKFPNLATGSYTVTPVGIPPYPGKNTYSWSPANLAITLTAGAGCTSTANNFTSSSANTFNISGQVTLGGVGVNGVTMQLTGGATGTVTTDSSGNYTFAGLSNGSYTVTPNKPGYAFTPTSTPVTINNANVTGVNFTATLVNTYSISGTVTLNGVGQSGVSMALTGTSTGTTTTDGSGNYSFGSLTNGNYTVTPSLTGYTFTPTNRVVTITGASVTGVNFTSAANTFSISGTVSGAVAGGVTMTLTGQSSGTTTTAADGTYTFSNLTNGNYTVTPTDVGYTFLPVNQAVTISGANVTQVNFTSSIAPPPTHSISGKVTGDIQLGVLMTLSGTASATTTTASDGTYSFTNLGDGPYTVTPTLTHYIFQPASISLTVMGANVTGVNFVSIKGPTWRFPALCSGFTCQNITQGGYTVVGGTQQTGVANTIIFSGFTSKGNNKILDCKTYVANSPGGSAYCAIYNSDGTDQSGMHTNAPGSLLCSDPTGKVLAVGWNTVSTLSSCPVLTNNTLYYLAIMYDSGPYTVVQDVVGNLFSYYEGITCCSWLTHTVQGNLNNSISSYSEYVDLQRR